MKLISKILIAICIVVVLTATEVYVVQNIKDNSICGTDTCYYYNLTQYNEWCLSYYGFNNLTITNDSGFGGVFYIDEFYNVYRCAR